MDTSTSSYRGAGKMDARGARAARNVVMYAVTAVRSQRGEKLEDGMLEEVEYSTTSN